MATLHIGTARTPIGEGRWKETTLDNLALRPGNWTEKRDVGIH